LFSNIDCSSKAYKDASTFLISNQEAAILGFKESQCRKTISYSKSLVASMTSILDEARNQNAYSIDLVIDAGASNIAAYLMASGSAGTNASEYDPSISSKAYNSMSSHAVSAWKNILIKMDEFCRLGRKDCMFIADGLRPACLQGNNKIVRSTNPSNTIANKIIPSLKLMSVLNSSYSAGYCDWFLANDNYSGDLFWCPPSIKAASTYVYVDTYFKPWDAPAGLNRGMVNNAVDCAFSPTLDEAGKIYNQCWNYAINYPSNGIILEGQKTFQLKKTAFDRINVRRLCLSLEKQVAAVSRYFVYEKNTDYLRQKFVDALAPIFDEAVQTNGISEYKIACDSNNNTAQTIDNNELHCVIAVKPVKTIEFIIMNFICTSQSANVSESIAS
jgi:hypothetical protein